MSASVIDVNSIYADEQCSPKRAGFNPITAMDSIPTPLVFQGFLPGYLKSALMTKRLKSLECNPWFRNQGHII